MLHSTNLAVLDMVGRITADVLKTGPLANRDKWSESRRYFVTVGAEILFASVILLSGPDQPLVLLVIASSLNDLVLFIYSCLLIQLNRGMLARKIGLTGGRLVAIVWAVLFYGRFSLSCAGTRRDCCSARRHRVAPAKQAAERGGVPLIGNARTVRGQFRRGRTVFSQFDPSRGSSLA